MALVTVYLDTPILSRILDLRLKPTTALAYADIANSGKVQLVTSDKTRAEVLRTINPARNSLLQFLVAMVEKVPLQTLHLSGALGGAPLGSVPLGGEWTDPIFSQLQQLVDSDDAEHIAQAVHAGCNYFLTLDDSTILSRVRSHSARVRALCGSLEFVDPEQLAADLAQ